MGVIGDWEHPYKTMDPGFEAMETACSARCIKRQHLQGLKPVLLVRSRRDRTGRGRIEYKGRSCRPCMSKVPHARRSWQAPAVSTNQTLLRHLDDHYLDSARQPCNPLHPSESYVIVKAPNGEIVHHGRGSDQEGHGSGRLRDYGIIDRHEGAFFERTCSQTTPSCPKTSRLVLTDFITWTPAPAESTAPASARMTTSPASATAWTWSFPSTIRASTPNTPARTPEWAPTKVTRHPQRHEGKRHALRVRGNHPQLSALLEMQAPDHLPRNSAVVLLGRFLQDEATGRM